MNFSIEKLIVEISTGDKNDQKYLLYIYRLKKEFDLSDKCVIGHKIPCGVTPKLLPL